MALHAVNTNAAEDDDDLDVEALRLAALQTLKKPAGKPAVFAAQVCSPSVASHTPQTNNQLMYHHRGRGRGRGRGNIRGFHSNAFQNFHPNNQNGHGFFGRKPSIATSNLITIVPTVCDDPVPSQGPKTSESSVNTNSSSVAVKGSSQNSASCDETVPAKFRRVDDDSDSDESSGDDDVGEASKSGSDSNSDDDDKQTNDQTNDAESDDESDKDADVVTLQAEEDEDEDSLERLMRELEEEISDVPKSKGQSKPSPKARVEKPAPGKVTKVKKEKKERRKKEKENRKVSIDEVLLNDSSPSRKAGHLSDAASVEHKRKSRSPSPRPAQALKSESCSPLNRESPARGHSPQRIRSPVGPESPARGHSARRGPSSPGSRSPVRSLLKTSPPRRARSPLVSRSPRRSRSPIRGNLPPRSYSPTRCHSPVRPRSPMRPCSSPRYLAKRMHSRSPSRLPLARSRSRSPRSRRSRSVTPDRIVYIRRSRSRTPPRLLRRSISPGRTLPPVRRSRSPGGRLYASLRRSRSISPRYPGPRIMSPRGRRSPSPYVRRSISPRRRSVSPRRRSNSPRWSNAYPPPRRVSPRRSRSPVRQMNHHSPSPSHRRSPYKGRSRSPLVRKYTPQAHAALRALSPVRYRSPSPGRVVQRRRSPLPLATSRHTPPHYSARPVSPATHRYSPAKQVRRSVSPSRPRERPVSPRNAPSVLLRHNQRSPSPRRRKSPVSYQRSIQNLNHSARVTSPVRKRLSPASHNACRSPSPIRKGGDTERESSSLSLSPSPERQLSPREIDDKGRIRSKGTTVRVNLDSKRPRINRRDIVAGRKDTVIEDGNSSKVNELPKRERRERKKSKKDRMTKRDRPSDVTSVLNPVLEARRRKFESGRPVEVTGKKIRLRSTPERVEETRYESPQKEVVEEINIEKEKERELEEVNEVDESILDRVCSTGVDFLWSDEEEENTNDNLDEEVTSQESTVTANPVQFKRTFNASSDKGGKENVPEEGERKRDESQSSSGVSHKQKDKGTVSGCEDYMDTDGEVEDEDNASQPDKSTDILPKTNSEYREYILSQTKGARTSIKIKSKDRPSQSKCKSQDSEEGDLRAELSRRRAERLTKVGPSPEDLPRRLLQSALQGVGVAVKSRLDNSSRRRARSPKQDDRDKRDSEGRRVLVLRRAAEQKEPAINITIPKVEPPKESSGLKSSNKVPVHLRLGVGKRIDDRPIKMKLKRNITVGRKKQV